MLTRKEMKHKAGYVSIIGKPNAGKSTLLNALLKQKISIVSDKPQTTRKTVLGILSEEDYQIIFLDTPGILNPKYLLQEKMEEFIKRSIDDADILLFIYDVSTEKEIKNLFGEKNLLRLLNQTSTPKVLLLNKVDLSSEEKVKKLIEEAEEHKLFTKIIPVSALLNFNTDSVRETILSYIPEHPKYYPEDITSSENERFFVGEIVREKIFELYRDEIPYSCETAVEEFKERESGKYYISVMIFVEKDSQKKIIIGKGGAQIKKLGELSRKDVEIFLDKEVYLELRVKVRENWRSNEAMMKQFGYAQPKDN
ncbi:MAG TPA: GTPase Era [Ignavibacteriaceae bacterium]|nr:GTPase Era [Ignavibacteriaceae bacterium]HOJ18379.1 GTPase Era [Ignavibacteriaceae bacterium]